MPARKKELGQVTAQYLAEATAVVGAVNGAFKESGLRRACLRLRRNATEQQTQRRDRRRCATWRPAA